MHLVLRPAPMRAAMPVARALAPACAPLHARAFSVASPAPSSTPPGVSAAATRGSFLARHPKKLAVASAVALGSAAAYYSTRSGRLAQASAAAAPKPPPFDLSQFTGFKSEREFGEKADITLYQYETCPFCNKVRAYLDYSGLPYRTIEVNPLTKAEKKSSPHPLVRASKEVPVLVVNGQVLLDSTPIIRNLDEIRNYYREREGKQKHVVTKEEEESLSFVDRRLVTLTAPNIYRSFSESLRSFSYIANNSQLAATTNPLTLAATKYVGAAMMYLIAEKKLKKKYGITDPRAQLYAACREWIEGNKGRRFRGGDAEPNLADITAFGVVRSLQNYDTGRDIMDPANTGQAFVKWYRDVEQRVMKNKA